MIVGVRGVLEAKGNGWVHLSLAGFTLQVHVPASTVDELGHTGREVHLHTHLTVKDDGATLYGFATASGLALFQMLLTVSGVGPRTALALLSSLGSQSLTNAIVSGNEVLLNGVTGVGKKSAARIVLELKGKLGLAAVDGEMPGVADSQAAVSALTALGYSAAEAAQAVAAVAAVAGEPSPSLEDKLRRALQQLAGSP